MAQKNRAQMLTDITTNIFNNVINFITGQNAQDRLVNLLDSSPNIISDKDQADGYVGLDAIGNMFSSYYNENISRADLVTLLTANNAVTYKLYQVNDAVGATKILLVITDSNVTLYPFAIDLTTAEIGTYNITTDTFTATTSTPDLQQVTDVGFTTTNRLVSDDGAGNAATLNNGLIVIQTGNTGSVDINASLAAADYTAQLPNKAALSIETFAMLSDIPTVTAGTNISVTGTSTAPIINSLSDRYSTSSISSNTIDNGNGKIFTVDANLAYIPLQEVLIVNSPSNHMHGTVVSYSGTTLTVDINSHTGSGTYTSWVINLDGTPVDAITGVGNANEIAYFTGGQVIASLAVATYPSLTELSYVKGVTSAIQTQINNAQTLSIECISGTITSPVDLATYYWCIGGTFLTASTSVTGQGSKFAYAFEITGITIRMTTTTAGSAEDSTLYLRNITTSTSTLMGTFKTNGNIAYTSITGLTISCNTTDEYCLEMRSPTWATNPANLRLTASLFLRRT